MDPIFSRDAQVVGWLKNDVVFDQDGEPRAYIRGRDVFSLQAEYLGRFDHGYFRDELGDAVAFVRGAEGWPTTPSPRVIPREPSTRAVAAYALPHVVPAPHTPTYFWAETDWTTYLRMGATAE